MRRLVDPPSGRKVSRSTMAAPRRAARRRSFWERLALTVLAAGSAVGLLVGALGAAPTLGQTDPTPTPTPITLTIATVTRATATPTPRSIVISLATATPRPARTPTATPRPTATPTPVPVSRAAFAAADWAGGFYRGDSRYYGRPWVAVYGVFSDYPRAAIAFELDAAPSGPATLTIAGLDDEWGDLNEVALEVNGRRVFAGLSPFVNWDGVGTGADAAWTRVAVTLPADLLRTGPNEIAVANLTPTANFGTPPYVLLAETTLEVPGAEVVTATRSAAPAATDPIATAIVVGDEADSP